MNLKKKKKKKDRTVSVFAVSGIRGLLFHQADVLDRDW